MIPVEILKLGHQKGSQVSRSKMEMDHFVIIGDKTTGP